MPCTVVKRFQVLFALRSSGRIEPSLKDGDEVAILLLNRCFHFCYKFSFYDYS